MVSQHPKRYEVLSSGGFLQVPQTVPYLSLWNLRNLDSTLNLGRCTLFIRTVPTQFSKLIIQLSLRLNVQCDLSRGTPSLWQAIHVFPPLPSSYRCLKEISPVLIDNFTYSPAILPKPTPPVLTNPRFRPHQGLEKECHPRRDEMRTVLNGMHLSMCLWIRVSKLFTASSTSFVPKTLNPKSLPQVSSITPPFGVFCNPLCELFGEQVWVLIPLVKWPPCDPFLLI